MHDNKYVVDSNGLTEEEFLKSYDAGKYDRPSVTNDILIFTTEDKPEENLRKVPKKGLQILLIQRREHPYINKWAIPGGFVNMNESLKEGAYRELKEETGIDNQYIEQLYTFGDVYKDKEKKELRDPRTRVISVANIALISKSNIKPVAGDDAKSLQWFWVNKRFIEKEDHGTEIIKTHLLELKSEDESITITYEIKEKIKKTILREKETTYTLLKDKSSDMLAFDHYKMIDWSIDRIRNKVEYSPIAFNLLPRLFTVKELQYVYEAILGREILNFRRKIGEMIVETDEKIEGKPYRPAQVFKFNEAWEHEF